MPHPPELDETAAVVADELAPALPADDEDAELDPPLLVFPHAASPTATTTTTHSHVIGRQRSPRAVTG
ncbi:MAG: hypothetical protein WAL38_20855 [Solirubrobacteraceae bacterium]